MGFADDTNLMVTHIPPETHTPDPGPTVTQQDNHLLDVTISYLSRNNLIVHPTRSVAMMKGSATLPTLGQQGPPMHQNWSRPSQCLAIAEEMKFYITKITGNNFHVFRSSMRSWMIFRNSCCRSSPSAAAITKSKSFDNPKNDDEFIKTIRAYPIEALPQNYVTVAKSTTDADSTASECLI